MSLQTLQTPSYIKRTKVLTTFQANGNQIITYDGKLKEQVQNVIGVELKGYTVSPSMAPAFVGKYPDSVNKPTKVASQGNHLWDVRVTHPSGTPVANFTVDLDFLVGEIPLTGRPIGDDASELLSLMTAGFLLQLYYDPNYAAVWSNFNVEVVLYNEDSGRFLFNNQFQLTLRDTIAPFDYATVEFLFGSGPNAGESVATVLGFKQGVDTVPDPVTKGAYGDFPVNLTPFRYLDVNIQEFPEFKPHSRIFLPLGKFSQPSNPNPRNVRLLRRPLRNLQTFTVSLRLPIGIFVAWNGDQNHELEFEVLSLEPGARIPGWVDQEFVL